MDPLWSETFWSTFKYFIILIVSTNYILCISWIIKCLIIIDTRCKHEDGHCRYNVTLRRVHATSGAVEKREVLHNSRVCFCSLSYPACNAHAPYCHLGPAPLYSIFPHYLINSTIFEKKLLNTKCVILCSLQLLSETFLILRRNKRAMIKKCVLVFM